MKAFLIYTGSVILSVAFCVGAYFLAQWYAAWPRYWQFSILTMIVWIAILINTARKAKKLR